MRLFIIATAFLLSLVLRFCKCDTRLWTKLSGTTDNDQSSGIAVDSTGNIYITGKTGGNLDGQSNTGFWDIFVTKYSSDGNKLWTILSGTM